MNIDTRKVRPESKWLYIKNFRNILHFSTVLIAAFGCNESSALQQRLAEVSENVAATSISLTDALNNFDCLKTISANSPNPAVAVALYIDSSTPCSSVSISASDVLNQGSVVTPSITHTFPATRPLIPVIIGSGGTLTLKDPGKGKAMTFHASSFLVKDGGRMQAGAVNSPVEGQINIVMAGSASASLAPKAMGASPIVSTSNAAPNVRDITVMSGGTLNLYGGKGLSATPNGKDNNPKTNPAFINNTSGTNSWTFLAAPAGPASFSNSENVSSAVTATDPAKTLTLATKVDWQVNDWISVATTDFTSHHTEIVQICRKTTALNPDTSLPNVTQLQLCQALKHYHYGGLAPTVGFYPADTTKVMVKGGQSIDVSNQAKSFYDNHTRNFGIDERAEVALLSRNIKLSSIAGLGEKSDMFSGGHLVVMAGTTAATVNLVGVEIEKFGQAFVGRYPLHLHHLQDNGSSILVQDVSVHHSYNKCFTVHQTSQSKFFNNVCVRTVGQGVYLEDGTNITDNLFMRNLVAGTMAAESTYSYPNTNNSTYWDGDNLQAAKSLANWYNINSIADTSLSGENAKCPLTGTCNLGPDSYHPGGFWITNINNTFVNNSVAGCQAQGRGYWLLSQGGQQSVAYPEFTGNRAHGCYNGLDTAPDGINNTSNPYPIFETATYDVTGASNSGSIITSDTAIPLAFSPPFSVYILGTTVVGKGPWSGSVIDRSTAPYSFSFDPATTPKPYTSGGKWRLQPMPVVKANRVSGVDVVIGVQVPNQVVEKGAQIYITGTGTALDKKSWTVKSSSKTDNTLTLKGTSAISNSGFPSTTGTWQLEGVIKTLTSSPIIITSKQAAKHQSLPLSNGQRITIKGVTGNTNANGNWQIQYPATGSTTDNPKFALIGSHANATYGGAGTWQVTPQPPVLLLNNNTVTRSRNRGFWGRSIFLALHNNRFAANPYGVSLAGGGGPEGNYVGYWDLAHRNVFAGMTRNNVDRYPSGCTYQVTGASNEKPIVITTTGKAPANGSTVIITGVEGNTTANGSHKVTTPAEGQGANTFSLNNVDGKHSGIYITDTGVVKNILTMEAECTDVVLANTAVWGNYPNPKPGSVMNLQGYSYYDGPARIESNRFVNFRYDPTGIYPHTPEARLLTKTDIRLIKAFASQGQLHGTPNPDSYKGYPGDPATGWIQSNAQTVPPTQYIKNSLWDNVDFKHQVYTEAVNLGAFNDGDKTTVILDKDSRLSGLRVVQSSCTAVSPAHDAACKSNSDFVPVSLNSIDYYATDFTVDEPHSRGPNNFRASSLMSPHKYATLNIESVINQHKTFRVKITRDMPVYGDTEFPFLFLNGRGQKSIYEPFVMDRMGYTVSGLIGTEHSTKGQSAAEFKQRLLFSYTDPAVKKSGEFFINRIALAQPLSKPNNLKMYRIRRQWGQPYLGAWPPSFNEPGTASNTCDSTFFSNQGGSEPDDRWNDCLARGKNIAPPNSYPGAPVTYSKGVQLMAAASMDDFNKAYEKLIDGTTSVADFIKNQTYFYDATNQLLYFYMIEDKAVMKLNTPYGTCSGTSPDYLEKIGKITNAKPYSDTGSVTLALNAACRVQSGAPTPTDLVACSAEGCASYILDLTLAEVEKPTLALSGNSTGNIMTVTNTTPVEITTTAAAPLTGTKVVVSGVTGNTSLNTTWTVINTGPNTFTLTGSTGTTSTGGKWQWSSDYPNTISRADYKSWNEFKFVYGTPSYQANGAPIPTGTGAPPTDGTQLSGLTSETDNTITYIFLNLKGGNQPVTENFPYNCLKTAPWSPVNPIGTYTAPLQSCGSAGN